MGYCTCFNLSVDPFDGKTRIPEEVYDKVNEEIDKMGALEDHYGRSEWGVYAKWYDWEEDMLLLSSKFPDLLFTLSGDGDDSDDKWIAYFNAGREQYCPAEIIYPDYDPSLLAPSKDSIPNSYSYER